MPPKPPPLTHFLCIPLVTEKSRTQLQASLNRFTTDISNPPTRNSPPNSDVGGTVPLFAPSPDSTERHAPPPLFPPTAIRPLSTLHLTLGVMSLTNPAALASATSLLSKLDISQLLASFSASPQTPTDDAPPPQPLSLSLHSLAPLPSPSKASILYATPSDASGRLHPFCNALRAAFVDAGLMVEDKRPLLLHCTIVNTIYARGGRGGRGGGRGRGRGRGKLVFDTTELVERYAGHEWMRDVRIERVCICEMGAKEVIPGEGVVYVEVAGMDMP